MVAGMSQTNASSDCTKSDSVSDVAMRMIPQMMTFQPAGTASPRMTGEYYTSDGTLTE
jgi:hypothetical protein